MLETRDLGLGRLHPQRRVYPHVTTVRSRTAHRAAEMGQLQPYINKEIGALACKDEAIVGASTHKAGTREASDALAAQLIPGAASGQVERVGARLGLVGAAGELVTDAGLTGWQTGESEWATRACFNASPPARGGIGNGEVVAVLRAVSRFLETHGENRFAMWHRGSNDHAPPTLQRPGVRRMLNADGEPIKTNDQHEQEVRDRMPAALGDGVSFEYFILAETFRSDWCKGFYYQAVFRVLYGQREALPGRR